MRKFFIFTYKLITSFNKIEVILIFTGLILIVLLFLISSFYFYHKLFANNRPNYSGILKEGFYNPINTLNPFLVENGTEKTIVNLLYDSLVRPSGKGNYENELAEKIIELEQGLKYEVSLKEVYWSNGERIIANDIIDTFSYFKLFSNNNYLKEYFKNIKIEKIDNYKVVFILPIRDNLFLQKLSYIKIIPAKIWSKYDINRWKENEEELIKINSGPFVFYKKEGNRYEFIRNQYYKPKPYLEKIIIYVYSTPKDAYEALKIKEINAIGGLLPSFLDNNLSRTLKIEKIIIPRAIALFFNSEKIDEKNVEKLKTIINRDEILKEIFNQNYAEISENIFSPSIKKIYSLANENKNNNSQQNQNFANDLKIDFDIIIPDFYLMNKLGVYLQKKYGLRIENRSLNEINNLIIPNKNYQGLLYGISYELIPNLRIFFDSGSLFNLVNKNNEEIIRIIQEIEIGNSPLSQNLSELENRLKKLPIIFLINPYYIYVVPENLINFNVSYLNDPSEKFVKIEEWQLK